MCEGLEFLAVERGVDSRGCTRVRVTRETTDAEALSDSGAYGPPSRASATREGPGRSGVYCRNRRRRDTQDGVWQPPQAEFRETSRDSQPPPAASSWSPLRERLARRGGGLRLWRERESCRESGRGASRSRARERPRVVFSMGEWRCVCMASRLGGWGVGSCTVKDDDQRRDGDESAGGRQQQIDVLAARLSEQRLREGGGRGSVQR